MGKNSHNSTIDESLKPWAAKVTQERYDFAVLSKRVFIKKYGPEVYERIANGQ